MIIPEEPFDGTTCWRGRIRLDLKLGARKAVASREECVEVTYYGRGRRPDRRSAAARAGGHQTYKCHERCPASCRRGSKWRDAVQVRPPLRHPATKLLYGTR